MKTIAPFQNLAFEFAEFDVSLRAEERLHLPPYKGSTLRGGFGHAFKRMSCLANRKTCENRCQWGTACAYGAIFETVKTSEEHSRIQATNLPHPFLLVPPNTKKTEYNAGEIMHFKLVLIGSAIKQLPWFLYAFAEMGKSGLGRGKGRFTLQGAEDAKGVSIYNDAKQTLKTEYARAYFNEILQEPCPDQDSLVVRFVTPTRLLHNNRLSKHLPFDLFIRTLLRRLSTLAELHCGQRWDLDYKELISFAAENVVLEKGMLFWHNMQRYSNRQKQHLEMGGFLGPIKFTGDWQKYYPLIRLGEKIHIGKNTSFGLGKYEIVEDEM